MDDFSVFGDSFNQCLHHLTLVLQRCIEKNLVLNWEKCHFMVKQYIVLGHIISSKDIEVDKVKVDPFPILLHLKQSEKQDLSLDMLVFTDVSLKILVRGRL